jgi:hypothetical protein
MEGASEFSRGRKVLYVCRKPSQTKVLLRNLVRSTRRWFPGRSQLRFACICNDSDGEQMLWGTDHLWEMIDYDLDFLH